MSYVIIIYIKHSYKFAQQINSILENYSQSYIKTGKDAQKYGKLLFIDSSNGYKLDLTCTLNYRGPCTQLQTTRPLHTQLQSLPLPYDLKTHFTLLLNQLDFSFSYSLVPLVILYT